MIHYMFLFLVCVLLGNNRLRALISASFAFSIIQLGNIPCIYVVSMVIYPLTNAENIVDAVYQFPNFYHSGIFVYNIFTTICCLLAARWLRESRLKPPVKLYVLFNMIFVFFPFVVLALWGDIIMIMSLPFLPLALLGTFFVGILLFLIYVYTQFTKEKLPAEVKETKSALSDKYAPFIQHLSRRELEVIKAVLAGNVSYKEISAALNISVNTVKTHLKHIYETTGVSNIAALSSLFRGYTYEAARDGFVG